MCLNIEFTIVFCSICTGTPEYIALKVAGGGSDDCFFYSEEAFCIGDGGCFWPDLAC